MAAVAAATTAQEKGRLWQGDVEKYCGGDRDALQKVIPRPSRVRYELSIPRPSSSVIERLSRPNFADRSWLTTGLRTPGSLYQEQDADDDGPPQLCQTCMRPTWRLRNYDETYVRVTNLPKDINACDFYNLLCPFGLMVSVYLAVDENAADSSERFGIVEYVQIEDGEQAISWLNGYEYDGVTLRVEWASPRCSPCDCPADRTSTVRVTNLPKDTCKRDLEHLCGPFGLLVRVYLAVDEADSSKKFGIVEYCQREDGEEAISWLNGYACGDDIIRVEWATAQQAELLPPFIFTCFGCVPDSLKSGHSETHLE